MPLGVKGCFFIIIATVMSGK